MQASPNNTQYKLTLLLLLSVFLCMGVVAYFVIKNTVNETIEHQAVAFAEIAAVQATTARSVYAKEVVEKLKRDGSGSHEDFVHKPGYVPLPAQFLKFLGHASTENTSNLFQYRLVSKWNLQESQGINDDFLRWAWPQVEQQDEVNPTQPIAWEPVWRFEQQNGVRVLRYLSPDAASQASCVGCHNSYENRPEIMARRAADGVQVGKQWRQYQLLGALSITIPLDKVEAVAAVKVRKTAILIFGILFTSLSLAILFVRRLSKQEMILRVSEKEAKDAKELLLAKHDVERAFAELSAYISAVDQHAIVSVADTQGRITQVNQKFCEISGYSEAELIGKNHNIVNSGHHSKSFFADMWHTIARGEIWRGECCNRSKMGKLYWVDSSIVPVKNSAGEIEHYISIRIDITERKLAEQRITHLANHDALTGLPNRYLLEDRFQTVLAACRRGEMMTAIMFIDLDKFKPINDTLGHKVGDMLLIEVTQRLRNSIREVDTVSRHGGDEFIVLLANIASVADAEVLVKKLLESVIRPYEILGNTLTISASIGIAVYPNDGDDMDVLLKHSDIAMYVAKQKGGNNYQLYSPDMHK
ncbi:MAG: diguanylate cyclase [Sideroxydans sp.]|nr:diguanylate cyclase [Sideroxydans sp.]